MIFSIFSDSENQFYIGFFDKSKTKTGKKTVRAMQKKKKREKPVPRKPDKCIPKKADKNRKKQLNFFGVFFRIAFSGFSRDRFFLVFFLLHGTDRLFSGFCFRFVKKTYVKLIFRIRKKLKKMAFSF